MARNQLIQSFCSWEQCLEVFWCPAGCSWAVGGYGGFVLRYVGGWQVPQKGYIVI